MNTGTLAGRLEAIGGDRPYPRVSDAADAYLADDTDPATSR